MDTDLRDRLDRSFGDGPPPGPHDLLLTRGHRALRRRRLVEAGAVAAVALVVVGGGALALGGHEPDSAQPMAPTATASASPTAAPWEDDIPIRYLDGELQVRPGVVVHQHLENPYGYRPPKLSDAFDLTFEGHRMWLLADYQGGGFGYSSTAPSNGWASFGDWVADQVGAAVPGDDGWPRTVRLDGDGTVVAAAGAHIVQRTDDPRLGASFAAAGTPTGAAVVTVDGDDRSYFVVWRVIDGELDVITTPPRDVVGATFEELLTHARLQYAAGEGLR